MMKYSQSELIALAICSAIYDIDNQAIVSPESVIAKCKSMEELKWWHRMLSVK